MRVYPSPGKAAGARRTPASPASPPRCPRLDRSPRIPSPGSRRRSNRAASARMRRSSLGPGLVKMKFAPDKRAGRSGGRRATMPTVRRAGDSINDDGRMATPTRLRPESPLIGSAVGANGHPGRQGAKGNAGTKRKRSSEIQAAVMQRPNTAPARERVEEESPYVGSRWMQGRSSAPAAARLTTQDPHPAVEPLPKGVFAALSLGSLSSLSTPSSGQQPTQVAGPLPASTSPEDPTVGWVAPGSVNASEHSAGAVNPLFDTPNSPDRKTNQGVSTDSPSVAEQLKALQQENSRLKAELQHAREELQKRPAPQERSALKVHFKSSRHAVVIPKPKEILPPAKRVRRPTTSLSIVATLAAMSILGAAIYPAARILEALTKE
eukprot:evm.model.scf_549EXC.1 EVM.evm.TU.scf_549EXC.1   scf_549EXC:46-6202(+)